MSGILLGPGGFLDQLRTGTSVNREETISELLALAHPDYGLTGGVLLGCLGLLREGKLEVGELGPHLPLIMDGWFSVYAEVVRLQRDGASAEWMFDEEYSGPRSDAEIVLDLFGYLPFERVGDALRKGLALYDPRLKLFASVSLLRQGKRVDRSELDRVAASDEVRILLWEQLREIGFLSLIPAHWSSPAQLAVSSLARWASHPMELGVPPEGIELAQTYPVETDYGPLEAYLLRFRARSEPLAETRGWMAGIAGPFHDEKEVDSPWSFFDSWEAMSPEEHFKKMYYRGRSCES